MTDTSRENNAAAIFDPLRPALIRVAYRMLGSVADAEDVVQDAFLRWLNADRDTVREPEAFLRRIVTRLCLDQIKSARYRRETYIGPWLPEPIVEPVDQIADDITLPLLLALERLSPLERAAFLLHDVFGLDFDEIAKTIDREPATCRQLASRARTHVRADRPRYPITKELGYEIAEAFFIASREGDVNRLRELFATNITVVADGGGKVPASTKPIQGLERVLRFFMNLATSIADDKSRLVRYGLINGLPGFVTVGRGNILQTTALEIEQGCIVSIFITRNPDKLRHLASTLH